MSTHDWSIQEIARLAGTTSRTLRHYVDIGLLARRASRATATGTTTRRHSCACSGSFCCGELGLGLPQIGDVLSREGVREASALETHLAYLREEQNRLTRQIASVETTINALKAGESLMAENMFDGFDHTPVQGRGRGALGQEGLRRRRPVVAGLLRFGEVRVAGSSSQTSVATGSPLPRAGAAPDSDEAQALAKRHVDWLTGVPGTPHPSPAATSRRTSPASARCTSPTRASARTTPTSDGGTRGAEFVRDALRIYAEANL